MSAMKTFNTISTNGTPFEYSAMPTLQGTVVVFDDCQYLVPMSLCTTRNLMQTMLSSSQVHNVLETINKTGAIYAS